MNNFELALKFTLESEGGFVDNPNDRGGATNYGVTQRVYDQYRNDHGRPTQSVKFITQVEVDGIYMNMYWRPARCPVLTDKLAIAHFDWAVNHGPIGAIETLQQAAGVTADGAFGPITNEAVNKADPLVLLSKYLELRRQWYKDDAKRNPTQEEFLDGWLNRVDLLKEYLSTL